MKSTNNKYRNVKSRNISIDEEILAKMSDDDLRKLFLEFRSLVNRGRRQRKDVRSKEIDLCYIQREIQNRRAKA
jgi:hypothetical protein